MKHEEWLRYKRQADHTLASARRDLAAGDFDWACFKSQQSAELAVNGYVRATREYVTGHSLMKLLMAVGTEVPAEIVDCGRELDKVIHTVPVSRRLRRGCADGLLSGFRRRARCRLRSADSGLARCCRFRITHWTALSALNGREDTSVRSE